MNKPIRHHYVPKVYLKNFATVLKDKYRIYGYNKNKEKIQYFITDNIALEKNFYTVDTLEDKYAWEKFYANNIESKLDSILSYILKVANYPVITDRAQILNNEQIATLSVMMTYQILRGKQARKFEKELFDKKAPEILSHTKELFFGKINEETDLLLENLQFDEKVFKELAMQLSLDVDRIALFSKVLFNHNWIVYKIIGNKEFITSDNPIMIINSISGDATPFRHGIAQKQSIVYFPISPKIMIGLYSFEDFYPLHSKLVLLDSTKECEFINNINRKHLEQSDLFCYCKTEAVLKELTLP